MRPSNYDRDVRRLFFPCVVANASNDRFHYDADVLGWKDDLAYVESAANANDVVDFGCQTTQPVVATVDRECQTDQKSMTDNDCLPFLDLDGWLSCCTNEFYSMDGRGLCTPIQATGVPKTARADVAVGNAGGGKPSWQMQFFVDLTNCDKMDGTGCLPIHRAVIQNDVKSVYRQCLVLKLRKIDVNVLNIDNLTPLQLAIMYSCSKSIYDVLISANADLLVRDSNGNNVFHLVALHVQIETMEVLLNYVATPAMLNDYNHDGDTPLIICAQSDYLAMAELLLQKGALTNLQDRRSGKSALFYAVENNFYEMTKLIMSFGGNPSICNFVGISILEAMNELECNEEILKVVHGKTWLHFRKPGAPKRRRPPPYGGERKRIKGVELNKTTTI